MTKAFHLFKKKTAVLLLSCLCVLALVAAIAFGSGIRADAATYDETNPEFTLALINSEAERIVDHREPYDPKGEFTQEGSKYVLKTDAYTAWQKDDDVGFAYRTYEIGGTISDTLTIETVLTERSFSGNSYTTASIGLMMRESLDPSSPEIFLHCREGNITAIYRSQWDSNTTVKYSNVAPVYPVTLRLEKIGTQYNCYYKNNGQSQFVRFATLGVNIQGPVLAGFAGHACLGPDQYIIGKFDGYTAVGEGKYDPSGSVSSEAPVSSESGPDWEDAPVEDDVLLSETFTDGDLISGEASVTNPIWQSMAGTIEIEPNGNRVWSRNFVTAQNYVGDETWTDYSASVDVRFTENCDPEQVNNFTLYVRHRAVANLGYYDYGITLYGGNTIRIYRRVRNPEGYANGTEVARANIENYLKPDVWQNIYVECMDDTIKVWFNGTQVLDYIDNTNTIANLKGGIGIATYDTDCDVDNIVVKKLEDPLGGDWDNTIGGSFNKEPPKYLQDWDEWQKEGYDY